MHSLSPSYTISAQIDPASLAALKEGGYTDIIMNRPDGEEPGQPSLADMQAAAEAAGVTFHYLPMTPGQLDLETVDKTIEVMQAAEGKIYSYCRSGARSTAMWALATAKAEKKDPDAILADTLVTGFDLAGLMPLIIDLSKGDVRDN